MSMQFRAKLIRVVDADTLDVLMDMGCDIWKRERVRLGPNFDAWESRHKSLEHKALGTEATLAVRHWLRQYLLTDTGLNEPYLIVHSHEYDRGKYGRLLCDIEFGTEEFGRTSLITHLRRNGHEKRKL